MRDGWVESRLGEVVVKVGMGPFGSNIKVDTFVEEGIPVISGNNLTSPTLVEKEFKYITEKHADLLKGSNVFRGDLVLTHAGTVGQVAIVPFDSRYDRYVVSQRGFYIRPNESILLGKYLLLIMKYGDGRSQLLSNINRTGVPSLSQPVTFTKRILVIFPPLKEQRRIVDVVELVDNYIAALQERVDAARIARNAVLHELLNAGGEGWVDTTFKNFITIQRGHDLPVQSRNPGTVPVMASNGIVGWHDEAKCTGPGIVTGRSGTIGKVFYLQEPFWPLNTTLYVTDMKGNVPNFVALVLASMRLETYAGGSTVPSLDRKVLYGVRVVIPSPDEQQRIVEILSSMDDSIQATQQTIVEVKNLRSGLLSDLLSGEHEIPESYDKLLGAA